MINPALTNLVVAPSSVTPQCGSNVTFTASVSGLAPITYQWFDSHTNAIPGATNASYTLAASTTPALAMTLWRVHDLLWLWRTGPFCES